MKKNSSKRTLIEWSVIFSVFGIVYFSGWHTEIIGRMQQGILFSGLFKPSVEDNSSSATAENHPEADFSLQLRNQRGELVKMEDLRGKVIFLNLWATWCPPCIAEMPGIESLAQKVKEEEIVFLMVSMDKDFSKAKAFRSQKDFSFDVYEVSGGLAEMYQSQSIPATYVISADGKLVLAHKGMADYNTDEFVKFLQNQL